MLFTALFCIKLPREIRDPETQTLLRIMREDCCLHLYCGLEQLGNSECPGLHVVHLSPITSVLQLQIPSTSQ